MKWYAICLTAKSISAKRKAEKSIQNCCQKWQPETNKTTSIQIYIIIE